MSDPATIDVQAEAPAPDIEPILAIHRDPNGFVGFVRKPEKPILDKRGNPLAFETLFSVKVSELRSMFPALAKWLTHDAYFTVNSPYRAAPYQNKTTGLPGVWRKETQLKVLTACYSDIDCGRPESEDPTQRIHATTARIEAEKLMDAGVIPEASIVARSGRGVYLFWLLKDRANPDELPRAFKSTIDLYKKINKALDARLQENKLPADTTAFDAARVLRVPGSIHRKVMKRATYYVSLDDKGQAITYTLAELAQFLELSATKDSLPDKVHDLAAKVPQWRKVKNPGTAPLRSNGMRQVNAMRCEDLVTLERHRGGFAKRQQRHPDETISPGRKCLLSLYASFLRGAGIEQSKALESLRTMATNCKPPYPSDAVTDDPPIETILHEEYSAKRRRRWSNEKLCRLLSITPDLVKALELKTIMPDEMKIQSDRERPMRKELIENRQAFMRQYIEKHGVKTCRQMVNVLKAAGYQCSVPTANNDLNALGFVVRHNRGGRPRKSITVGL